MTSSQFICDIANWHNTWLDVLSTFVIGFQIIALVYVWRTTRKR